MKLAVPKYPKRSWQLDLGLAAQLISPDGELRRVNTRQQRAILAVAYQVQIARLHGVDPEGGACLLERRQRRVEPEPRSIPVRLGELDVFSPGNALDLSIWTEFDQFAAAVPRPRIGDLVHWAPPLIASDAKTGRMRVFGNQLTAALARYLAPDLQVPARLYGRPPVHQLTFVEASALVLLVFGNFIDHNSDLVCRLCGTSAEAALLIGKSINTAALIRKRLGVLEP